MARYRKQMIHFLLTNQCQLACDYCYEQHESHEPLVLDINFAKRGIDDFFNFGDTNWIRFFASGEATLEFSLMKDIFDYARLKVGNGLKVEVQSNGHFNKDVADWIGKNVDIIWISHDGKEVHDIQRKTLSGKPTSEIVESNISYLSQSPKISVGVRSTITPSNILFQERMVHFFKDLGVSAIAFDPMFAKVGETREYMDFLKFAEYFVKAKILADEFGVFCTSILTTNFDEKTDIGCQACLPQPHLTPDGFVSACDMATSGKTKLQDLIYGKYDKKNDKIIYFPDKIKNLQERKVENLIGCLEQKCIALTNCAGGCLGENLNETGNMYTPHIRRDVCEAIRYLFKYLPRDRKLDSYLHP